MKRLLVCAVVGTLTLFATNCFLLANTNENEPRERQAWLKELTEQLQSKEAVVRATAARRLGELQAVNALTLLTRALTDPSAQVRQEAARALGRLHRSEAVPALLTALKKDSDKNVRFYAAWALGEIKDPRAVDVLLQALNDPEWTVRNQAAWALHELHDERLVPKLVQLFMSRHTDSRELVWLLRRLSRNNLKVLSQALQPALHSPDTAERLKAWKLLDETAGEQQAELLQKALNDSSRDVRLWALNRLVEIRPANLRSLLNQLAEKEKDPQVKQLILEKLKQLPSPLRGWWSFERGGNALAQDQTGNGNNGQAFHCSQAPGKVGKALSLDGKGFVEFGRPAALPIAQTPLTVMAWVKAEAPEGVVIARGGAACGFSLYFKDGRPCFGIRRQSNRPPAIVRASRKLLHQWVHLTGVVRPNRIELYVNGKLAGQKKTKGLILHNCGQGMEIGFDVGNSPAELTTHFRGLIDEVKIFATALSAADILEEVNSVLKPPNTKKR